MKKTTKYLLITTSVNLFIALIIISLANDFNLKQILHFLKGFALNLGIGILGLYLAVFFIGNKLIYKFKKDEDRFGIFHGILAIFLVLLTGIFFGSTVGFIQEGIPDAIKWNSSIIEEINDYYFKPLFWIMYVGSIPTLISGIILGIFYKMIKE